MAGTANIRKMYMGQPSTTAQTLYTAPSNTVNQPSPYATAVIKDIYLANTTSSPQFIILGINGIGVANQLIPTQTIAANTLVPVTGLNKALSASDFISAMQGTSGAITVFIDGIEVQ